MATFSIVIVTLNAGRDLKPTIDSVLCQEFSDWEIIVKDGGSTDGSLEDLADDSRIRTTVGQDHGVFDAMNQALRIARGEFVCFLNAGDYFVDSRVLSDVAAVIGENATVPFFYGSVKKLESRCGYQIYPEKLSRRFLFMNSICHQCWFLKRKTYLRYGGFETDFPTGADSRLLLKMIARDRKPYKRVPRVVACYKGGGVSTEPVNRKLSAGWNEKLKAEIFTRAETLLFVVLMNVQAVLKKALYDRLLYRVWRTIQATRFNRL